MQIDGVSSKSNAYNFDQPVKRCWLWQKIYEWVLKNIFLPSLNTAEKDLRSIRYQYRIDEEMSIRTDRGTFVRGLAIYAQSQLEAAPKDKKWIVYFSSNGECVEQKLLELHQISHHFNRNVIAVNYYGAGKKGEVERLPEKEDLERDGDRVVRFLQNRHGVSVKNIIALGFSQGGSIALKVAEKYQEPNQEMGVVVDKTFTTYVAAVEEQFKHRFFGLGYLVAKILKFVVEKLGWTFDSWSSYLKIRGPIAIIDHPEDGMIRGSARLGQKALEHWEKERQSNPSAKKPIVIQDRGFLLGMQGNCLMTSEEYGAHMVGVMRGEKLSQAYQQLFNVINSDFR